MERVPIADFGEGQSTFSAIILSQLEVRHVRMLDSGKRGRLATPPLSLSGEADFFPSLFF